MSHTLRCLLAAGLVSSAACSADLPATRTQPLNDGGEQALHVQRDGQWVPCEDSERGARRLVRTADGALFYAGQGLINQTCARGQCHSSEATGELRSGAPAGLDFDLPHVPLTDAASAQEMLRKLEVHQRAVYDDRNAIWNQIEEGRMPPGGVGSPFRGDPGLTFVQLDGATCTDLGPVGPVLEDAAKRELGIWLACGSPVVESSDPSVPSEMLGEVGNVLPACDTLGEIEPTFENVFSEVLEASCVTCHSPSGIRSESDYSTPQVAYENLVNAPLTDFPNASCAGAAEFLVVPNDPEASYLLHKMDDSELSDPFICPGSLTMPYGQEPLPVATSLVRRWIEAGAPGPGESAGGDGGSSGSDGGTEGGL